MGNTTKKRRGSILIPRKINPYELRDQELKIEEDKRAKRKFLNWKRRQQSHFRRRAAKKDEMFKWEKVQMTPREESSQITAKEFLQL